MVACSILGCKSNTLQKIENITFFRYPNEENIRQCWIKSTGRLDWQPTKNTRVCSLHFEPHCFRKTQMRVFLFDRSIPTIHVQKTIQPNTKNRQQLGQNNMDENPTTSTSMRAILNKAAASSGLPLINVGTQTMMSGYDVSSCVNCAAKSGGEGSSNKKRKLSDIKKMAEESFVENKSLIKTESEDFEDSDRSLDDAVQVKLELEELYGDHEIDEDMVIGPKVVSRPVTRTESEEPATAASPASELEALIERLERVTSRLERLEPLLASFPAPPEPSPHPAPALEPIVTNDMSVNGYQDLILGPLQQYLQLSQQIGGDVAAHASLVNNAFQAQFNYIQLASSRGKPSQGEEQQLLAPTSAQISAIQQFREKNRTSPVFNHLSAISESIPALGWVAVAPTPGPYVKEMNDAGQFYTNRVLKEWKEKDKKHAEWCRAWVQLLTDLQAYVKQYHTTGLVWSGKGSGAGAPPPPPGIMPPPPMPTVDFSNMSVDDRSALFAEINRGEGITNNLRKVTSDMQTHKNPQLRQGPAPFKSAAGKPSAPSKPLPTPGAGQLDKPPVFARDGKKWLIEYQKGNQSLVVENAEMNNVVYMFRCRDSSLTVKGKINGVVLDSCTKCAVVFENLVSSIEFVNCQSVQMQVLGKVPTISIDKTDGCQIYLSPQSLDVEIVSSKSSEMNVMMPKPNGDYAEHPIPEQFKTVLNKNGLSTSPVESTG